MAVYLWCRIIVGHPLILSHWMASLKQGIWSPSVPRMYWWGDEKWATYPGKLVTPHKLWLRLVAFPTCFYLWGVLGGGEGGRGLAKHKSVVGCGLWGSGES